MEANGIASLAHPIRLHEDVTSVLPELRAAGLNAVEAYHSDHSAAQTELYLQLAAQHGLLVTGGFIASLPPILLSLVFYRYIVSGLSAGGVKG